MELKLKQLVEAIKNVESGYTETGPHQRNEEVEAAFWDGVGAALNVIHEFRTFTGTPTRIDMSDKRRKAQTSPEDRIRIEFRNAKRARYGVSIPDLIMRLAKKYERPCAEIREIVGWPGPNSPGYRDPHKEEIAHRSAVARANAERRQREWAMHNTASMDPTLNQCADPTCIKYGRMDAGEFCTEHTLIALNDRAKLNSNQTTTGGQYD